MLTIVNHIEAMWIIYNMFSCTDNILVASKILTMCNYTCWNWMGRKLPTAFNSQQLLRWLRPKRYIFSIFLVNKKLKKICSNSQQEKWSVTI